MGIKNFLKECHKRSLFKLLSVYIVTGWVILQVLSVINEPLNIPQKTVTYMILLLLIGLPIYMFILWKLKLKDYQSNNNDSVISNINSEIGFKKKYFISVFLLGMLSFVSAALIYNNSVIGNSISITVEDSDKIAVLDFNNNTGNKELDVIGNMSSDWLIHGITEYSSGEVISPETMKKYANLSGVQFEPNLGSNFFEKILRPDKLITGSYYINGSDLIFNCVIQNVKDNTVLIAFPKVSCDQDKALDCIEDIKQKVLGYLYGEQDHRLILQKTPPKYEAYEKLIMANDNYENEDVYLSLLNESISIDSTFFEPQVLRVQHYYNAGEFNISDSLNKLIASNPKLSKRQKNLLGFCEALIEGKNDRVYRKLRHEYDIAPFHLETNSSIMVILNQFINKPEKVEDVFNAIDMEGFELDDCIHCKFRYLMMGTAYNSMKKYSETIELLDPVIDAADYFRLDLIYVDALLNNGNFQKMKSFIENKRMSLDKEDLLELEMFIGDRYLVMDNEPKAVEHYDKILDNGNSSNLDKANVFFQLKDYNAALPLYENLWVKDSTSKKIMSKLASTYFNLGKQENATKLIEKIKSSKPKFDYGYTEYLIAQYYATVGEEEKALNYLLKSVADGNFYYYNNFNNDPIFKELSKSSNFKKVMTFWH